MSRPILLVLLEYIFLELIMYVDRAGHLVGADKEIPGLVFESFYYVECDNG